MNKKTKPPEAVTLPSYEFLTFEESAAYLGPSFTPRWFARHVYELCDVASYKIGRRRLIPRAELDRLVSEAAGK